MERKKRYFKKTITYFFNEMFDRDPSDDEVELLYKHNQFVKDRKFLNTFSLNSLITEHCNSVETGNPESFKAGFELCAEKLDVFLIQRDTKIGQLEQQVDYLKQKYEDLKYSLKTKVEHFESLSNVSIPVLYRMEEAYKAGQQSMEPMLRSRPYGDMEVYASVKQKHNFRTWCNKIWKYGKAIKPEVKKEYKKIEMANVPMPEFVEEHEGNVILGNKPRRVPKPKRAEPNRFFAPPPPPKRGLFNNVKFAGNPVQDRQPF